MLLYAFEIDVVEIYAGKDFLPWDFCGFGLDKLEKYFDFLIEDYFSNIFPRRFSLFQIFHDLLLHDDSIREKFLECTDLFNGFFIQCLHIEIPPHELVVEIPRYGLFKRSPKLFHINHNHLLILQS